jgi:hypothetical protein
LIRFKVKRLEIQIISKSLVVRIDYIPVYHKTYNPHIICHTSTFLAQKMTSTADVELMAWPG